MAKIQLVIVGLLFLASFLTVKGSNGTACFSAIYSFGDSFTDTGNAIVSNPLIFHQFQSLPYGETYFGKPTGRCSDGRLVIDFLATSLGFPFLPPYLQVGNLPFSSRASGVNFAVAGGTALDSVFLISRGVISETSLSLNEQMGWFTQLRKATCGQISGCEDHFSKALYVMGEIGANDYLDATFILKPLSQIQSFTPLIIARIHAALQGLIEQGGKSIVVQGIPPLGCSPSILTVLRPSSANLDGNGCLASYNELAQNHNLLLQQTLQQLSSKYPGVTLVYADYYNTALSILENPAKYGFGETFETCCGSGGGQYNFNLLSMCGTSESVLACKDPAKYINWDGIHLTEATYQIASDSLLKLKPLADLITKSCS